MVACKSGVVLLGVNTSHAMHVHFPQGYKSELPFTKALDNAMDIAFFTV